MITSIVDREKLSPDVVQYIHDNIPCSINTGTGEVVSNSSKAQIDTLIAGYVKPDFTKLTDTQKIDYLAKRLGVI